MWWLVLYLLYPRILLSLRSPPLYVRGVGKFPASQPMRLCAAASLISNIAKQRTLHLLRSTHCFSNRGELFEKHKPCRYKPDTDSLLDYQWIKGNNQAATVADGSKCVQQSLAICMDIKTSKNPPRGYLTAFCVTRAVTKDDD